MHAVAVQCTTCQVSKAPGCAQPGHLMRAGEVDLGMTLVPCCSAQRISTCPTFLPARAATACRQAAQQGMEHHSSRAALLCSAGPCRGQRGKALGCPMAAVRWSARTARLP